MNAERSLIQPHNKNNLLPGRVLQKECKKRYCGVCPACNTLKSMPVSTPEKIAGILKSDTFVLRHQECISGFLQENYGNSFTQRVLGILHKLGVHEAKTVAKPEEKKILRAHTREKADDQHMNGEIEKKGAGSYLDYQTRSYMESKMGHTFGDVRIHTDNTANRNARSLNAYAYTIRNDIYFASGKYKPDTFDGKKLLAHELVHVAQNRSLTPKSGYKAFQQYTISSPNDSMEHQADKAASAVISGSAVSLSPLPTQKNAKIIQRKAEKEEGESGWLAEKLSEYASNIPGFTLISFIIGKNPITGKPVERNAKTFLEAIMGLIPGGALLFKNLNEAGVIDQAFEWISGEIKALNLTWDYIKGLIAQAWVILKEGVFGVLSGIGDKIKKIIALFEPPYQRIKTFCVNVGKKVMNFIFEAVLKKIGAEKLIEVLKKVGDVIGIIAADPIKFLKNLLGALKKGFNQFVSNIWEHLKAGLMGWLFGALARAGIEVPKSFDLKSIFGLVMQVLGLTKEFIRKKAAKIIGEKNVELIEKAWSFISTLISSGISGLWEMIKEHVGNLKDIVIGAIQDWVVTKIVTAAITKLVSMFNPVGAIITAVQTIYNTVMFFIERMQQILALVNAIVESILSIAQGAIDKAADWIEKTMARTLPVIISFLARLIGLGGISEKIKGIIKKLQEKVEKAVDKVIDKVVAKVKGLLGKILPGKKEKPMSPDVKKRWDAGMAEIGELQKKAEKDPEDEDEIKKHLAPIKSKYGFKKLDAKLEGDEWVVDAEMNPKEKKKIKSDTKGKYGLTQDKPITFNWPGYDTAILNRNPNGAINKPPENDPFQKKVNEESTSKKLVVGGGQIGKKSISAIKEMELTFERGDAVENYRRKHQNFLEKLKEASDEGIEIHHKWPLFVSGPDEEKNLVPMFVASEHRPWHKALRDAREKSPQKGKTVNKSDKLGSDPIGTFYKIPAQSNKELEKK